MTRSILVACMLAVSIPLGLHSQDRPVSITVEVGPAWQSYNDVEVPNDGSATRLSLVDVAGSGPWPAGRVELDWQAGQRHTLRVMAAPLTLEEWGSSPTPVRFAGEEFAADTRLRARYKFNSFRISYRYLLHDSPRTRGWIGATAKLRDAVIRLEQDGVVGRKDDLGFVPLLHLAGVWDIDDHWSLHGETDALAGGPGRAVDANVKVGRSLGSQWRLGAGYRMVEGGADVPAVYAFAWLHYAVVSVTWTP